jgi:hypothetical protein
MNPQPVDAPEPERFVCPRCGALVALGHGWEGRRVFVDHRPYGGLCAASGLTLAQAADLTARAMRRGR